MSYRRFCDWCGQLIPREKRSAQTKYCTNYRKPDGKLGCKELARNHRRYWNRRRHINAALTKARKERDARPVVPPDGETLPVSADPPD